MIDECFRINMQVRRIGGGFGGKGSRGNLVLAANALAAKKLNRPVRVTLTLKDHMTLVGWREPFKNTYKVCEYSIYYLCIHSLNIIGWIR